MSTVSRIFTVTVRPQLVVAYLADFAHAEQWDPGTVRCVPSSDGPVEIGSTWKNTSKIAGITTELIYTLEQLSNELIVLVGRNDSATSTETIEIEGEGEGSRITYTNEVIFNGAAKLATPIAKVLFEKLGDDTEEQLLATLNALGT